MFIQTRNQGKLLATRFREKLAATYRDLLERFQTVGNKRGAPFAAQLALLALAAGLVFPLFWPGQRVAGLHVVFLGGFSLITFTVATRVVLGHSGNESLFETRLPSLQIATFLLLAGAALRAVGDFLPNRPHWLSAASYLWIIAAGGWAFAVLPKVGIADPFGDLSCSERRRRAAS